MDDKGVFYTGKEWPLPKGLGGHPCGAGNMLFLAQVGPRTRGNHLDGCHPPGLVERMLHPGRILSIFQEEGSYLGGL
jgi:hypothetical protein